MNDLPYQSSGPHLLTAAAHVSLHPRRTFSDMLCVVGSEVCEEDSELGGDLRVWS